VGETRRRFSEEFKREAVRLAFEGSQPVSQVARELDVRPDMLRRWRRRLSGEEAKPSAEEQEVLSALPTKLITVCRKSGQLQLSSL